MADGNPVSCQENIKNVLQKPQRHPHSAALCLYFYQIVHWAATSGRMVDILHGHLDWRQAVKKCLFIPQIVLNTSEFIVVI